MLSSFMSKRHERFWEEIRHCICKSLLNFNHLMKRNYTAAGAPIFVVRTGYCSRNGQVRFEEKDYVCIFSYIITYLYCNQSVPQTDVHSRDR